MRRHRSLPNLLPVPRRFPSPALVVVQLVDLLERHILRLVDEEVHEKHRDPRETAPDPEDVGLRRVEGAGEVGRDEGEEPVEEPVGGGGLRVESVCFARLAATHCLLTMERHLARVFSGNNSPVTTQAAGPKLEAKNDT